MPDRLSIYDQNPVFVSFFFTLLLCSFFMAIDPSNLLALAMLSNLILEREHSTSTWSQLAFRMLSASRVWRRLHESRKLWCEQCPDSSSPQRLSGVPGQVITPLETTAVTTVINTPCTLIPPCLQQHERRASRSLSLLLLCVCLNSCQVYSTDVGISGKNICWFPSRPGSPVNAVCTGFKSWSVQTLIPVFCQTIFGRKHVIVVRELPVCSLIQEGFY